MSGFETEIKQLIANSYTGNVEYSLSLSPYLIIKIPDKKLAFHLVRIPLHINQQLNSFFCNLTDYFLETGYRLIHIWEDMWTHKRPIVESRIQLLVGKFTRIHARTTTVQRIDKPTLDAFLVENHLYGSTQCKYKYGLYAQNKLVAVASFSGIRTYWRKDIACRSAELVRFANLNGYSVAGGMGKLLSFFINEQQPDDVMSYADRDWSNGASYEKLGFDKIEYTPAQCFWIHPTEQIRYYPHKLPEALLHQFQQQNNIMLIDDFLTTKGYVQIYNSGNIKYLFSIKKETKK